MKDELYILHKDIRQRFLQSATLILGVFSQACSDYPRELSDEVDFLHACKHESSQNSEFAMSLQYLKK